MRQQQLAFDRSMRSYDVDKRLHVEMTPISKATVNEYLGREIPDYQALGLDPNKAYALYRPPEELEKAAASFRNLPLLSIHKAISADDHDESIVIGCTGDTVVFEAPYLKTSLAVWTADGIKLIESGTKEQLSSAYRYRCELRSGVADGKPYVGLMRDLAGNHVAIVTEGRAGPDVAVLDEQPKELSKMPRPKLIDALKPFLAKDADLTALDAAMKDCEAEDE